MIESYDVLNARTLSAEELQSSSSLYFMFQTFGAFDENFARKLANPGKQDLQ
jgi:hypothetical protein